MHPSGPPRIVDDLIPIILESSTHWWPRDFQRLALITTAWVGPVRKRLYGHPTIRSFHACNLLVRTLRQNPHILSLVRGINLRPIADGTLSCKDMASLRFILSRGELQSITLGGELAVEAERFLHMMSNTRSITSLHIDGYPCGALCDGKRPASLAWDEVMAYKFPKLRTLRLSNVQLALHHPSMSYSLRIAEIYLDNVNVVEGFLHDLCHESWHHVRKLSIIAKSAQDDEQIRMALECCENLELFYYELRNTRSQGTILDEDLPPFPLLRKLRLCDVDVNPQTLASLAQACPNLEHLSVTGRATRVKAEDWEAFVRSGALPLLRALGTSCGTNHPPFVYWPPMSKQLVLESCTARGIRLL